ncbi:preprotein translocase subunit YajC [Adhaeribacter aquaticus]|uniref:preprotein translocase subunit YajC n=1 Tax=Adhaeribacter aquaticus TaxID=299567 RepID=UPI000419955A|nr:preprotein translocase subunit YajC [Adhaeribacter aquaticus]
MLQILLQAPAPGSISNILFIGAIILVFYFFMIRPQQKKLKDQKKFRESLTKGSSVVTIGGLHGKIVSVEDTTVVLEVDRGVRLTFDKTSIASEAGAKTEEITK